MSLTDNIYGPGSKFNNVNCTEFSPFLPLLDAKNRLSISEMVSAQCLQKVWVVLKKNYLRGINPYVPVGFLKKNFFLFRG